MTFEQKCSNCWTAYHQYKDLRLKDRIGYAYGGVEAGHTIDSRSPDTNENVLEHTCGTVEIVWLLRNTFPSVLDSQLFWDRMFNLMLHHDLGEGLIGDSPDDGTRDEEVKNVTEMAVLKDYLALTNNAEATALLLYFEQLQHPKLSPFGAIAWMIDKVEALLMLAWYESYGIVPTLSKKSYLSDRDNFYLNITQDNSNLAGWSAHFLDYAKGYPSFEVFLGILKAAVIDVRGEWFDWTEEILSSKEILYGG